jgi:hypothetical protein
MTTTQVARALGVAAWMIHSCFRRGLLAPPPKLGPTFSWATGDLERARLVLISEGYLSAPAADDVATHTSE